MEQLSSVNLKNVLGGSWDSGVCHISNTGFNNQAFIDSTGGHPGVLILQGSDKTLTIDGLLNNGLLNAAQGSPLANITQPPPQSC